MIGGGSGLSALSGAMLTDTSGSYPLLGIMIVSGILCLVSTLYIISVASRSGPFATDPGNR